MSSLPARMPRPSDLVAEYETKKSGLEEALKEFHSAVKEVEMASSIGGTYAGSIWCRSAPSVSLRTAEHNLLKSAWRSVYLKWIEKIATAKDKARIEIMLENPPEFTIEQIREHFGAYVLDPWSSILRGLAEVFCDLDPAFRSHSKIKVGVKGLPKRVIISNVAGYGRYSGRDKIRDIVNALASYQNKPFADYAEINHMIEKDGEALRFGYLKKLDFQKESVQTPARGVWLKTYQNGNGHLYFDPDTLLDVNRALAEYYGDVLPDVAEKNPEKRASTEVAKDLQYYPTPAKVVERLIQDIHPSYHVLEPQCGCGRIMDGLKAKGIKVTGIEVDPGRAEQARAKGHSVLTANFLALPPTAKFDAVVMNPPFYGKHYMKHVEAAIKWLKPGGQLVSILPASAKYDHGIIDANWLKKMNANCTRWDSDPFSDLPVGSFAESGTNINTVILSIRKAKEEARVAA